MNKKVRELQFFFFSQHFSDGIRVTVGVLLPSLVMVFLGHLQTGITLSLGAVCASIADMPGPVVHKRNGMVAATILCAGVALLTGFARLHVFTMGLEILLCSFLFSMLLVYGMRASVIGLAALLIMVLTMDRELKPLEVFLYAALVAAGGLWYTLLSLLSNQILPYRAAQQALGESIREVANFLRLKASFYSSDKNQEVDFRTLITQQVKVSEKQDAVRELLFKSRMVVKESTSTGRTLVKTFVDMVDLYEQVSTIQYDYAALRTKFASTGILEEIAHLIQKLSDELDNIGFSVHANLRHQSRMDLTGQLEKLKNKIDQIGESDAGTSNIALKKIFVNLRTVAQSLREINAYLNANEVHLQDLPDKLQVGKFVSHQSFDPRVLLSNLTFKSVVFRFAFRMALVAVFTFVLTQLFPYGNHSYWVLLTVIFILKPAFSLTKQRNYQRVVGTLVGAGIGLLVLYLVPGEVGRFIFLVVFMTGFYSVQRSNYGLSVIFMTPFVLILFGFLGGGGLGIVQERVVDTLVGCAIGFLATYFILPTWESHQVRKNLQAVLEANLKYLQVLTDGLAGKSLPEWQYKLARKEVYVSSANLSSAFQRMTGEPKSKQRNIEQVYQFVVLNHLLSSYLGNIVSSQSNLPTTGFPKGFLKPLRRAAQSLTEALRELNPDYQDFPVLSEQLGEGESPEKAEGNEEEELLKEQLGFVQKVCADIRKLTGTLG